MKTIYLVRHQHHGLVATHAFETRPTAEQLAPIVAELDQRHEPAWILDNLAKLHDPSFKVPAGPWLVIVEVPCCEEEDIPIVVLHGGTRGASSGRGRVE